MMHNQSNSFICPFCQTSQADENITDGDKVFCRKCGNRFVVDGQGEDASYPLIGKLAVTYKFINEAQLKTALKFQREGEQKGKKITLEEAFARLDLISPAKMMVLHNVKTFLEIRRQDKQFGQIAVQKQAATPAAVNEALSQQADAFKKSNSIQLVGDILVEKRIMDTRQRDAIMIRQGRITKEDQPVETVEMKDRIDEPSLFISEDRLTARLRFQSRSSESDSLDLEKVKALLSEKGICHGLIPDERIHELLLTRQMEDGIVIAEGKPAEPGRNADIRYFFDTDYLCAGKVDADGQIDFKDRGRIPQVKAGDLLAQKIPAVEGRPGIDIFGDFIPVEPVKDLGLRCGGGAELTPDALMVVSKIDGQPLLSHGGQINVYQNLTITGDVNFKTGHIDFDGNVKVTGTVQTGFRVTCINFNADEIAGGIVQAKGDMVVTAGIIDAHINCRGNVSAAFIKNSNVRAYGNVSVTKEIIDTEIVSSGICQVKNGPILTSSITTKKGIFAFHIGNGVSKASRLKVGVGDHLDLEMKKLEQMAAENEKRKTNLKETDQVLADQLTALQNMVAEMAHEQERTMKEKKALEFTLSRFAQKKTARTLEHAATRLREFEERIAATDETISGLFQEQDEIQKKIVGIQAAIDKADKEIAAVRTEMEGLRNWADGDPPAAIIRVLGSIYEGTIVSGSEATLILRETYQNVHLREMISSDWGGVSSCSFNIIRN